MAKRDSVFSDEWRRCLEEHYKYVVKNQDKNTEETLTPILERFGFREDDLRKLTVEATMRADDMPDDFVPEMELSEPAPVEEVEDVSDTPEPTFIVHPSECSCAECMDVVLEEGHDEEGQPLDEEAQIEQEERTQKDTPKQKSLF